MSNSKKDFTIRIIIQYKVLLKFHCYIRIKRIKCYPRFLVFVVECFFVISDFRVCITLINDYDNLKTHIEQFNNFWYIS